MVVPRSAEQAVNQGLELYKKGRVRDALRRFEMALEMKPSEEEAQAALYNKACCHAFREEGAQAQEALRDALRYGLQFSVILSDPDMAAFRAMPEFRALQEEARKGGEEVGGKFRRDLKLIAEVQAPFRGVRRFLYVALGMAAGIATVITIPRFILAVQGGVDAPDLLTTGGNLAIDLGGGAAMVGLYLWEQRREEEQMGRVSRDETLSRLPLRLQSGKVVELVQLRGTTRPVSERREAVAWVGVFRLLCVPLRLQSGNESQSAAVGQGGGAGAAELRRTTRLSSKVVELVQLRGTMRLVRNQLGDWSCSPSVGTGAAVPAWGLELQSQRGDWSCSPSVGTGAAVPAWGLELQSQRGDWSCSPSVGTGAAVPAWGLELQSQLGDWSCSPSVGTGAAVPAWGLELQSQCGDWSCSPSVGTGAAVPVWGLELQSQRGDWSCSPSLGTGAAVPAWGLELQSQRDEARGGESLMRILDRAVCVQVILSGRKEAVQQAMKRAEGYRKQLQERGVLLVPVLQSKGGGVLAESKKKGFAAVKKPAATLESLEEFEEKAREAAAKRVAEADRRLKAEVVSPGEWDQWVRSQQKAEKVAEGTDAFIVLRLDGRVRKSGTGMPDWADLINELPPLDSLVSKLER
ncbi:unnamed protein product [Closterium sp. NIES-64]|nr:unnamed protein product [Closterium sp. NIES-65]CAI5951024.1 unnamed protein product [Closterium sp. NIES-64]